MGEGLEQGVIYWSTEMRWWDQEKDMPSLTQLTYTHTLTTSSLEMLLFLSSVQLRSVSQSCSTLCDAMKRSTPGLPVHHQLPVFTQTHVHRVSDAIQPSHLLSSPSPAFNLSQYQCLFKLVSSLHQVAKMLAFPLQHPLQSFQWIFRNDFI